jgi:hypothetical protein
MAEGMGCSGEVAGGEMYTNCCFNYWGYEVWELVRIRRRVGEEWMRREVERIG